MRVFTLTKQRKCAILLFNIKLDVRKYCVGKSTLNKMFFLPRYAGKQTFVKI